MFSKNKKLLMLASAAVIALPVSVVSAASTNIDAVAVFLNAITLTPVNDMDFAVVEFSAAPAGGDTASLGTDGSIAYAGNFTGGGTGTAGQVNVATGSDGYVVEVFCDTTATMTEAGGQSIDVVGIEVMEEGGVLGAFGTANACNGIAGLAATTMTLDVSGGTADDFYFGGQVDGATASVGFVPGSYSTANAGGDDVAIDVFYQ